MEKVNRNIYRKKIFYIIAFIMLNIAMFIGSMSGSIVINTAIFLSGILLIGGLLYNNSKLYLLYYSIFALCFLFVDLLVTGFLPVIFSYTGVYFSSMSYFQITMVFIIRIVEYVYIKLFTNFINKREAKTISKTQTIAFLAIPLFSIIYIMTLVSLLQIYAGMEENFLMILNIVLVLILNIYVTHIFDTMSKNNILQNEVDLYHVQSELQHKYYDNLEHKYKESRKLIHDIRNHLQSIERLYENNEETKAKEYTNDIHMMLNELNQKYYTSNRVLNIILNDKIQSIKNTNIDFECKIGDVDIDFIREIDITTIFANLLDNSIEAAKKVEDNSYIKFSLNKFNDFVVVNIVNSMAEKPIRKNKSIKSTKRNHEGIGLDNIIKTIEKYEGNLVIDFNDEEFKVNIVIPSE